MVEVGGPRPRVVPVLARYHEDLLAAARFAGGGYVIGGPSPTRRNVTTPLVSSLWPVAVTSPASTPGGCGPPGSRVVAGRSGLRPSWTRPGSPAPSASATSCPSSRTEARTRRWPARTRRGDRARCARRRFEGDRRRARGAPARIEARSPSASGPASSACAPCCSGMLSRLADGRPAHLVRVHAALVALPRPTGGASASSSTGGRPPPAHLPPDRAHLLPSWPPWPKEAARTASPATALSPTVVDALSRRACPRLQVALLLLCGRLDRPRDLRPPPGGRGRDGADPEASWGHRRGNSPGQKTSSSSATTSGSATMVDEEARPGVPELVRRLPLTSCHLDPVPAFVPASWSHGRPRGGASATCSPTRATAHRVPEHLALPLRALGADLVIDLHPHDRGTQGTFAGAICCNGNLYCPATPTALFGLGPLARAASDDETAAHDARAAELARYKLGRITERRRRRLLTASAARRSMGKLRCPLRSASMALPLDRPEVQHPPEHPPPCCTQKTITVPRRSTPRPARSTTTRQRPTAAPMPGAAPPSAPTHREGPGHHRHRPGLVPADGTRRRSPCSSSAPSSCATSGSSSPSNSASKKMTAGPHGASHPGHAGDGASGSPISSVPPTHPPERTRFELGLGSPVRRALHVANSGPNSSG